MNNNRGYFVKIVEFITLRLYKNFSVIEIDKMYQFFKNQHLYFWSFSRQTKYTVKTSQGATINIVKFVTPMPRIPDAI